MSNLGAILAGALLAGIAALVWPRHRRRRRVRVAEKESLRADRVASALDTIAMCLQAGLTPARALSISGTRVPEASIVRGVLADVHRSLARGDPGGVAWQRHTRQLPELQMLAGAWTLTESSGASLQPAVAWSAGHLRERRAAAERLGAVSAGARSSIYLMLLLPFTGGPIGFFIGIPPWELYGNVPAAVACILGFGFAFGGVAISRRILARALRPAALPTDPPHEDSTMTDVTDAALLLHLALAGGSGIIECLEAVVPACRGRVRADLARVAAAYRWGKSHDEAWAYAADAWEPVAIALGLALDHGAAPAEAVRSAANRLRASETVRLEAAAGKAGTLLIVPLAMMFLPAFMLTTVLPLVINLVPGAMGGG